MSAIPTISLASASLYAGISENDTATYSGFLDGILLSASDYMENYTDRVLVGDDTELTEYVSYNGNGRVLFPSNYPIDRVVSINDDADWTWDSSFDIDSSFYRVNHNRDAVVFKTRALTEGEENVKITYTAGYAASGIDNIPADLQLCTKMIFTTMLHDSSHEHKGKGTLNIASISREETVTFVSFDILPPQAKKILDRYRKVQAL